MAMVTVTFTVTVHSDGVSVGDVDREPSPPSC